MTSTIGFSLLSNCHTNRQLLLSWTLAVPLACFLWPTHIAAQGPIVLRDLTLIKETQVSDFDAAGVVLADQRKLPWKVILQADVGHGRQAEFDQMLKQIGLPQYRLETRLKQSDWSGAFQLAKEMDSSELLSQNKLDLYQIRVALARGHRTSGRFADAAIAFLNSTELYVQLTEAEKSSTHAYGWSPVTLQRRFDPQILPIEFDRNRAVNAVQNLTEEQNEKFLSDRGGRLYLAAFQLAAGELDEAEISLEQMANSPELDDWAALIKIQVKMEREEEHAAYAELARLLPKLRGASRAFALFLQGRYFKKDATAIRASEAQLSLLTVAALYSQAHPELAAAALFRAAQIADDTGSPDEAEILRQELLESYAATYHGRLLKPAR